MSTDITKRHELCLAMRNELSVCGITDVLSFDDTSIYLDTVMGKLTIDGEGLHIKSLDVEQGNITVDGKIDGLSYSDETEKQKNGIFGRLFR